MNAKGTGFAIGLTVGIILVIILFKVANTNRKVKTEYDERQQKIRGKAYKYAFYTMVCYQLLLVGLSIAEITVPFESFVVEFFGIFLGATVLGAYCIWNDVYWGLNNDHKRYYIIFSVCLLLNLLPVLMPALRGEFARSGMSGAPMLNVIVIIMMMILIAELCIKHLVDRNKKDEED
ncbi:MAG: hypothetical protein K6F34_00385 [Lachnospiraceae bacterium]|nr:hypothetical protein [Lachnospiraceae bacterium]